jgi:uncharacterized protein YutE (UPF0331/DUF86 family)
LNIKLIEDRLGFILKALEKLKRLSHYSKDEFLKSDNPAIAESYLRRSLEAMFDIGRHILAKTAGKGIVEYKEIARMLGKEGVLSRECSQNLLLMAGYRNRLVHFYHEVEDIELFTILQENLIDIEKFAQEIKQFIEEYRKGKHTQD